MRHLKELRDILLDNQEFMEILNTAKQLGLREWCIGAGIVRNIVWSKLHSKPVCPHKDIDFVYFDAEGSLEQEKEIEQRLIELKPELPWDAKNQALVHLWYEEKFGFPVEALTSVEDAISTWPETATCIGVYSDSHNQLQVIAPYGLEDLFAIVLRRNPKRVTKQIFEKRLAEKSMLEKWPKMVVVRE